jgi:hypothetical protein
MIILAWSVMEIEKGESMENVYVEREVWIV